MRWECGYAVDWLSCRRLGCADDVVVAVTEAADKIVDDVVVVAVGSCHRCL